MARPTKCQQCGGPVAEIPKDKVKPHQMAGVFYETYNDLKLLIINQIAKGNPNPTISNEELFYFVNDCLFNQAPKSDILFKVAEDTSEIIFSEALKMGINVSEKGAIKRSQQYELKVANEAFKLGWAITNNICPQIRKGDALSLALPTFFLETKHNLMKMFVDCWDI